jgi:hypothetical protein
MSGMFFVVAMTEKTSYQGRIPVFLFFSGCVHPGQNFSSWCLILARLETSLELVRANPLRKKFISVERSLCK